MRRLFAVLSVVAVGLAAAPIVAAAADDPPDLYLAYVGSTLYIAAGQQNEGILGIESLGGAADATLKLTTPTGISVPEVATDVSNIRLTCSTAGRTVTCAVPQSLGDDFSLDVTVQVATGAAPGALSRIGVQIEPTTGTDSNPADNHANIPVQIIPTARITYGLSAPTVGFHTSGLGKARLAKGVQTHFVCAPTSHGPNRVVGLIGVLTILSTEQSKWQVRLTPTGKPISLQKALAFGELAPSQTKDINFYVTALTAGASATIMCQIDAPQNEYLQQAYIDRAGDVGVAVQLTSH